MELIVRPFAKYVQSHPEHMPNLQWSNATTSGQHWLNGNQSLLHDVVLRQLADPVLSRLSPLAKAGGHTRSFTAQESSYAACGALLTAGFYWSCAKTPGTAQMDMIIYNLIGAGDRLVRMGLAERLIEWIAEAIDDRNGKHDIYIAGGAVIRPSSIERVLCKAGAAQEICIVGRTIKEGRLKGTQEVCSVVVPSQRMAQRFRNDTPGLASAIMMEFDGLLQSLPPSHRPSRTFIHFDPLPRTGGGRTIRSQVADWVDKQSILTG